MSTRKTVKRAAAAIGLATAIVIAPMAASTASATPYWSPVTNNCGSKFVQITFKIAAGGVVRVGYTYSNLGDYSGGTYWTFNGGTTNTRNPGYHSLTWEVWASPGNVTQWSVACVSQG